MDDAREVALIVVGVAERHAPFVADPDELIERLVVLEAEGMAVGLHDEREIAPIVKVVERNRIERQR